MTPLPVAALAMTAVAEIGTNEAVIACAIDQAADAGARLLLTPECALCGWPPAVGVAPPALDHAAQDRARSRLAEQARARDLVLVLGMVVAGDHGWTNSLVATGAGTEAIHAKRALVPSERPHFRPGDTATVVTVDGWRLALAICYEVRFAPLFTAAVAAGADAVLLAAHLAGPDPDPGTKAAVIPAFCSVRAAEGATPLLLANTAADDRWLDSGAWDCRGRRIAKRATGLLTTTLHHRREAGPWYDGLRRDGLARGNTRPTTNV